MGEAMSTAKTVVVMPDPADEVANQGYVELTGPVTGTPFEIPTVAFDGHRFPAGCGHVLPVLYLAFRARRKDPIAAQLLTAFGMTVTDADGKSYWPPEGGE
jgi:hypothetical protein